MRIKVIQTIYSLMQSKESNYYLGLENIADHFAPNLMAEEKQDVLVLDQQKKQASDFYTSFFEKKDLSYEQAPTEIKKTVQDAILYYHQLNQKDKVHYKDVLLQDIHQVEYMYYFLLVTLSRLIQIAEQDQKESIHVLKTEQDPDYFFKLKHNPYLHAIDNHPVLRKYTDKYKLNPPMEEWKFVFKKFIKKDPIYIDYMKAPSVSLEAEKNIIVHIAKNYLLKQDSLTTLWEDMDYHWVENDETVRSLVLKCLKGIQDPSKEIVLPDLSPNWEEDNAFLLELFAKTLALESTVEGYISAKVKNWDMDRLAIMDKMILQVALTEMIEFSNIPVKVTINEYIDISKTYSTPKSKQFVNGLLDTISEELLQSGVIKKSGKGLLDNK
ncbi:MAG: transcription antitermination factor NusB [Cytophagaceae bacterium]|nr:transcription antitermination factor NusB [Cytophagaceae bacterium]